MSLRTSIILLVVTVTLGTGLGSSFLMTRMMHETMEEELGNQAVVAVQGLALHVTHNVINGEIVEAKDGLALLVDHSPSIQYAYIFDFEGNLFAHSFTGNFPAALAQGPYQHHEVSSQSPEIRRFETGTGRILDIGYPLIDGLKGHVHVGLDEEPMHSRIEALRDRIIGLTFVLAGLGIMLGVFMSRRLAHPLSDLAGVMRNLDDWETDATVDFSNSGMEVTNLAHAFNNMLADRRQASRSMRESEERLSAVFDAADNVAFVTTDLGGQDTRILGFSPGAEKVFGYSSEEVIGHKVAKLHLAEMVEKFPEMQKAIREGRKGHQGETTLVRKSGEEFAAIFTIHPLMDVAGELVGTLGVTIDITDRKQAEQALLESEERFWSLFENAPMGYQSLSEEGVFVEVNETWCQMFGYTRGEVIGKNFSEFLQQSSVAVYDDNFPRFKQTGQVLGAEFEIIRKDGTEVIASLDGRIERWDDGSVKQTHCVLKDITERKQAEAALLREKEKAESYLNITAVIMVAIDLQGIVTMINKKGCEILGYQEDEILGRAWLDHFVPERIANEVRAVSEGLLDGVVKPLEFFENPILTKSGRERLIAWHNSVISDSEGNIVGHLSSGEDITETKKLRADLLQAQKMESVGRLAGGIAHDFNNMLSVILGYAEMAADQTDPSDPIHSAMNGIRTAAERSAELTGQLLAFARKQTIDPKILNLNEVVVSTLSLLERLIEEGIEIVWRPQENIWPVKVDPSQIDQILMNLCANARDAMDGVGKVVIETQNVTVKDKACTGLPGCLPGQYVVLIVSDTGCGMDQETLGKLFEPFFTTKEVGKGTGLGLAMIYGAVEQNGGFIDVDSELGRGTSFRIHLPRRMAKIEPVRNRAVAAPKVGGQETILLVEDEPMILELTTKILSRLGYDVLAAATPNQAIQIASDHVTNIPLVCTDVVMPGMSGLELFKALGPLQPNLKCLYMSGYTADVIANQGILDEGIQFIQKPFTMGQLAAKVRESLDTS